MLTLTYHPDPFLRTVCKECTYNYDERYRIGNEMIEIMFEHDGYGLAANQVGVNERMFVMRDPEDNKKGLIFCNPYIKAHSKDLETLEEGCLSVPGKTVKIPRFKMVILSYELATTDLRPLVLTRRFLDMDARCIQHELNHLDGTLIFDHINSNLARKLFLEKYAKRMRTRARVST